MPAPPIEIYTTRWCPYCIRAKALLKRKGAAFTEIDVGRQR
ncbi:MAG: glutaredoxin domain-containing protein, partial [Pseudolabrys sp.]